MAAWWYILRVGRLSTDGCGESSHAPPPSNGLACRDSSARLSGNQCASGVAAAYLLLAWPPSIILPPHRSHITYSAPHSTQAVLGWYGTPNGTPSSTWHATWRATWQPHDTIHDTLHDTTRCGTRNRRQRAQSEHPTYRSTGYLTARPTHFSARSSAAADPPPYVYRNVISA